MLDHALPQDRTQLSLQVFGIVRVLLGSADMLYTPDSNDDACASRIFNERHLLGIEEAERTFGLEMASETIKQGGLVLALLGPLSFEAEVRFAFSLNIQIVFIDDLLH